jgi:hypothetical protein
MSKKHKAVRVGGTSVMAPGYDLPFASPPLLTSGATMRKSNSSWSYVSSSHEIARIYDWRMGA